VMRSGWRNSACIGSRARYSFRFRLISRTDIDARMRVRSSRGQLPASPVYSTGRRPPEGSRPNRAVSPVRSRSGACRGSRPSCVGSLACSCAWTSSPLSVQLRGAVERTRRGGVLAMSIATERMCSVSVSFGGSGLGCLQDRCRQPGMTHKFWPRPGGCVNFS
jgi:hypothetical protein